MFVTLLSFIIVMFLPLPVPVDSFCFLEYSTLLYSILVVFYCILYCTFVCLFCLVSVYPTLF